MEKLRPYESEVKEKNLLIGKLRHEAIILNEHLTKALRLLKRGASSDNVDKQLMNNLLLSFLSLPRQDSKRFEVLKILSSVLNWSEEQKEIAGLVRPGTTSASMLQTSLRSPPLSPGGLGAFSRRASSVSSLSAGGELLPADKEYLNDLLAADFLGQEDPPNDSINNILHGKK